MTTPKIYQPYWGAEVSGSFDLLLRRINVGYQFSSNKEQINHLMFMDDIKLVAKDERGIDSEIRIGEMCNISFEEKEK